MSKKKIQINFTGLITREEFNAYDNSITNLLKKHYDVEICEDPDYVFCGVLYPGASFFHGVYHEYLLDYPCVRIMIEGENFIPDFNLVDYSICQYPVDYLDRNCYFPCGVEAFISGKTKFRELQDKSRNYPDSVLETKDYFASFIASHDSRNNIRGDFFKELDKRKRVESVGTYLNNMPNGEKVDWLDGSKIDFQKKCRFSLCFESTDEPGFITEKIVEAFYCDTVPIYYGSSNIKDIFNPKAFIDISDFPDFDSAIDYILTIENDDEKYLEMLRQPIFIDPEFPEKKMQELEAFLCHIFDQPLEKAYRRSRYLLNQYHEEFMIRAIENEIGYKELWSDKEILKFLLRRKLKRNRKKSQ